jgi:hypothetical protein
VAPDRYEAGDRTPAVRDDDVSLSSKFEPPTEIRSKRPHAALDGA